MNVRKVGYAAGVESGRRDRLAGGSDADRGTDSFGRSDVAEFVGVNLASVNDWNWTNTDSNVPMNEVSDSPKKRPLTWMRSPVNKRTELTRNSSFL